MPTGRHSRQLQTAIRLAKRVGCVLVALCSKGSSARHAYVRAKQVGIDVIVIDTNMLPTGLIPDFATTELLADTTFVRRTDTSLKRNLGLLLAHLAGWERIVFLDDDIEVPRYQDLTEAAGMLDTYDGVGLQIGGYPDNSVVCHAYREAGGTQDTFVGGGALAVRTSSVSSFFPKIYNEDWFFLLDKVRLRPTTLTGLAKQNSYDPFENTLRARSEEFGDTLAEGVFALLDQGRRVQDASEAYWRQFLDKRRVFINEVIYMVLASEHRPANKARMVSALRAALSRNRLIEPALCEAYLRAWRTDTSRWRRFIADFGVPKHGAVPVHPDEALTRLGLTACSHVHLPSHEKVLVAVS